jgi:UTP-glucose-1-phosphate uridylyltransferase
LEHDSCLRRESDAQQMLPVVDKPKNVYGREAVAASTPTCWMITGRKNALEKLHFDRVGELGATLLMKGDIEAPAQELRDRPRRGCTTCAVAH